MFFGGLLMRSLMGCEIIAGSKRLAAVTLVITFLQMHCVDMHFHVRPLTKAAFAVIAFPFFFPAVCRSNMSFQGIHSIECIRTMGACVVSACTVLRREMYLEVISSCEYTLANWANQSWISSHRGG